MEWLRVISYLHSYGADVLLIGAAVYGLTFLCKKTIFRRLPKRLITFLPFALGILLCAVFALLVQCSSVKIETDPHAIVQKGVAAGSAATVIHILYEQFVRNNEAPEPAAVKTAYVQTILQTYFEEIPMGVAERVAALPKGENGAEQIETELKNGLPAADASTLKTAAALMARLLGTIS